MAGIPDLFLRFIPIPDLFIPSRLPPHSQPFVHIPDLFLRFSSIPDLSIPDLSEHLEETMASAWAASPFRNQLPTT